MRPPMRLLAAKTPKGRVPAVSATASRPETPRAQARKKVDGTGQRCANPEDRERLTSRKRPTTVLRSSDDAIVSVTRTPSAATATSKTAAGVRGKIEARETTGARMARGRVVGAIAKAIVRTTEAGTVTNPRRSLSGLTSQ